MMEEAQLQCNTQDTFKVQKPKKKIIWEFYNYPPCLKLIHFNPEELEENENKVVFKLQLGLYLVLAISALNFIDAIVQAYFELENAIIIFYSILNFCIFTPVAFCQFYYGYRGMVEDNINMKKVFFIISPMVAILWFSFSIISVGTFNGFIKTHNLYQEGYGFLGFSSMVESILYLINSLLSMLNIFLVYKFVNDSSVKQTAFLIMIFLNDCTK